MDSPPVPDVEGAGASETRALQNVDISINEYLDGSKAQNSKKLEKQVVKLFHETISSLSKVDSSLEAKQIDEYSIEELPNALARFFMSAAKENGQTFSSSSLNTFYRALARYLRERETNPIDITTDVNFKKVSAVVKSRQTDAAKQGFGPGKNKSECLTSEDLEKLNDSGKFDRSTPQGLVTLAHYILMTGFGCRCRKECRAVCNEDLVLGPLCEKSGLPIHITLSERITKTRKGGKNDQRDVDGRIYLDLESPESCMVRSIMVYQSRKTPVQRANQFAFLLTKKQSAVKNPDGEQFWYTNHPMGENTIGKLLKTVCEEAGIDTVNRKITGTSARKTLVQSSADSGVPANVVSKLTGQAREQSQLDYMVLMKHGHKAASLVTSRSVMGKQTKNFNSVYDELKQSQSTPPLKPRQTEQNQLSSFPPAHGTNQLSSSHPSPEPSHYSSYPPPPCHGPRHNYYPPPPPPSHYNYYPPPPPPSHYNYYPPPPPPSHYGSYNPPPYYGPNHYNSYPPGPNHYNSYPPPEPSHYSSYNPPPYHGPSQYSSYQDPGPSHSYPQQEIQYSSYGSNQSLVNKENENPGQYGNGPSTDSQEQKNYVFKFKKINTGEYSYTYL